MSYYQLEEEAHNVLVSLQRIDEGLSTQLESGLVVDSRLEHFRFAVDQMRTLLDEVKDRFEEVKSFNEQE